MSARARRPRAVAFDVIGTLFDLSVLRPQFDRLGLPPHALKWWFAVLLRDGFALSAAGGATTFAKVATVALAEVSRAAGCPLPPGADRGLIAACSELPAHSDSAVALQLLRGAEVPAVALSNGSVAITTALLDLAGLRSLVSGVLSVEGARHWKPRPEPYRYAASELAVEPSQLAMVAVHPWDLHGAATAGLVTGWVNRGGGPYPEVFSRPHVEAPSLDGAVYQLLRLPEC